MCCLTRRSHSKRRHFNRHFCGHFGSKISPIKMPLYRRQHLLLKLLFWQKKLRKNWSKKTENQNVTNCSFLSLSFCYFILVHLVSRKPGANLIKKQFTTVIYCHAMVIPSFCVIKLTSVE
jgi:hypothetical protein